MLDIFSGRVLPRLNMETRRLASHLANALKGSEPFLGTVADKVEEIIEGRKGSPFAVLTYTGETPVSVDSACRFAVIDLDLPIEDDTMILLADMVQAPFIRKSWQFLAQDNEEKKTAIDYSTSVTLCLHNNTEHLVIVSLGGLCCVAEKGEIEVPAGAVVEVNIYTDPEWIMYVAASGSMFLCFDNGLVGDGEAAGAGDGDDGEYLGTTLPIGGKQ